MRAHRLKQAVRSTTSKAAGKAPSLAAGTCAHCHLGFFHPAGRAQEYCSASCRTGAYRARRNAALVALEQLVGVTRAQEIDAQGMKRIGALLAALGFHYDASCRRYTRPAAPALAEAPAASLPARIA